MLSVDQMQRLKQWLKDHKLYKAARGSDRLVRSLPYLWQTFPLLAGSRDLMLGHAGKLEGWMTADIRPGADFKVDIKNLRQFRSESLDTIYASHVLEHINCADAKLALLGMHRALRPGGKLFVVVPDLVNVSRLLESDSANIAIDIIYGIARAREEFDPEHKFGYTRKSLSELLSETGFSDVREFQPFIDDTSKMCLDNIQVSLCLRAAKR